MKHLICCLLVSLTFQQFFSTRIKDENKTSIATCTIQLRGNPLDFDLFYTITTKTKKNFSISLKSTNQTYPMTL